MKSMNENKNKIWQLLVEIKQLRIFYNRDLESLAKYLNIYKVYDVVDGRLANELNKKMNENRIECKKMV